MTLPEQPLQAEPLTLLVLLLPRRREAASPQSVTRHRSLEVNACSPLTETTFGFCQVIPIAWSVPEEHHCKQGEPCHLLLFPLLRDRVCSLWSLLTSGQTIHPQPDFPLALSCRQGRQHSAWLLHQLTGAGQSWVCCPLTDRGIGVKIISARWQ